MHELHDDFPVKPSRGLKTCPGQISYTHTAVPEKTAQLSTKGQLSGASTGSNWFSHLAKSLLQKVGLGFLIQVQDPWMVPKIPKRPCLASRQPLTVAPSHLLPISFPSIHPSIRPSVRPSMHPSIHPSIQGADHLTTPLPPAPIHSAPHRSLDLTQAHQLKDLLLQLLQPQRLRQRPIPAQEQISSGPWLPGLGLWGLGRGHLSCTRTIWSVS